MAVASRGTHRARADDRFDQHRPSLAKGRARAAAAGPNHPPGAVRARRMRDGSPLMHGQPSGRAVMTAIIAAAVLLAAAAASLLVGPFAIAPRALLGTLLGLRSGGIE